MDREPASVGRFLIHLVSALGIITFTWNVAAPDSWKDAAHAWGDSFVAAGESADALQRTSWRHNLGLAGPKYSDRPKAKGPYTPARWFREHPELPTPKVGAVFECDLWGCKEVKP